MMMRTLLIGSAAVTLALVLCACGRSPQVNFYTLEPVARLAPVPSTQVPPAPQASASPTVAPPAPQASASPTVALPAPEGPVSSTIASPAPKAPVSPTVASPPLKKGGQVGFAPAPAPAAPPEQAAVQPPSVVVGPVTVPEMVDRPQIVVRAAANRVEILETRRWAEPLKSELPRVLAENLRRQLGWDRVAAYQQYAGAAAQYRVLLDLMRLDPVPGDAVTIEAQWTIKGARSNPARTGRSVVREKITGEGYDALVAACSRALAALSAEIATAIRAESAVSK